jgi:hypothetical protein
MKPEKRGTTLADRFVARRWPAHERILLPRAVEQIQRGVRNARKFVLDEEAARRVAKVVAEIPDLLVREHQFARAPFDLTWIEWPSYYYWMEMRDRFPELHAQGDGFGETSTADYMTGYLFDQGRINAIAGGIMSDKNVAPELTPMQYRLHTEWPVEEQLEFGRRIGASRLGIDKFLWGSTYEQLGEDERRLLRTYNTAEFVPFNPAHPGFALPNADNGLVEPARGCVGELRTVIALLLILNRPSLAVYRTTLPNHRGWHKGKTIPFMSHTVVNVSLDAVPMLRLIGTPAGESVARRRHEVRGHYCHDKTARDYMRIAGCIHEWQGCDEEWTPWADAPMRDVNHWLCKSCGGKRWWRADHERGTAEVGFVAHDGYDVTA